MPADALPERLILDGQQRLTSLFLALLSGKAVETQHAQKKRVRRWYFIHIPTALDSESDRESAVYSVAGDRKLKNFRASKQQWGNRGWSE